MPLSPFPTMTLQYNGLFDLDGMYAAVTDWAKNYGFMWHEKKYNHKVPSPGGAEQEIDWEMTNRVTEYFKYIINISLHIYDLRDVDIEVAGKKKSLSNARITIKIIGTLEYDWQKLRDRGKFAKWIAPFRDTKINDIEDYEGQLFYRVQNLHNLFKQYLDTQSKKYIYFNRLGEN